MERKNAKTKGSKKEYKEVYSYFKKEYFCGKMINNGYERKQYLHIFDEGRAHFGRDSEHMHVLAFEVSRHRNVYGVGYLHRLFQVRILLYDGI